MGVREARIEEGRNYIGEDRVDEMVVTTQLVILAEECGGVSARRVEVFQDGEKSVDGWTRTRATQTPQRAERRQTRRR